MGKSPRTRLPECALDRWDCSSRRYSAFRMSATQIEGMISAKVVRTRLPVIEIVLSAAILVFAIKSEERMLYKISVSTSTTTEGTLCTMRSMMCE